MCQQNNQIMQTINGKIYKLHNGNWVKGCEIVCESLSKQLNILFVNQTDLVYTDECYYKNLVSKCRANGNHDLAMRLLEKTILQGHHNSNYLAELSSCYRSLKKPQKAIDLYETYKDSWFAQNAAFLTSIGFAYYDLGMYENAASLAKKAKLIDSGNNPEPLTILFSNLKRTRGL